MTKILLGVIGNGRRELLSQTVASAESRLKGEFYNKVMINDAPSPEYNQYLIDTYGDRFTVINHHHNMGLSGSVMTLWEYAQAMEVDYVVHLEEDFTFNQKVYLQDLAWILEQDPHLVQIALKRQPCNTAEIEVGGFMEQAPSTYIQHTIWCPPIYRLNKHFKPYAITELDYLKHRNFFTLNPCMYPISTTYVGWEHGWGEKEFGERLFANELIQCGYLGKIGDAPLVEHIGGYRADGWFV